MMVKRIIAAALSAALCFTSVVGDGFFSNRNAEDSAAQNYVTEGGGSGEYNLESNNSFGNFITASVKDGTLTGNAVPLTAEAAEPLEGYSVGNLGFDAESGTLIAVSTQPYDCRILFEFTDDKTDETVLSVEADVKAGDSVKTPASADTSKLPEFYGVQATLINGQGRKISNTFKITDYTEIVQDIKSKTVNDFDEENVVNFDESKQHLLTFKLV